MIREMTHDDLDVIVDLEAKMFPSDAWPESQYLYELDENPFSTIYVYEEEGKVLGYCDLWIMYEQAQIANIAVNDEVQRKGIGSRLLYYCANEAIRQECENLSLEVRVSNTKAIGLYEKYGFITVATRKKYYEDGEDAYLMVKPLGGLEYDNAVGD